jgi:hypothetical protein
MPPKPPLTGSVKLENNWTSDGVATAHNISYALFGTGVDTSDPTTLTDLANNLMSAWSGSGILPRLSEHWHLVSVTASDNSGGSDVAANSTHATVSGTDSSASLPPQCAIAASWQIAARYRGGKPRWYIPGIPSDALSASYGSALDSTYAGELETALKSFYSTFQLGTANTHDYSWGTLSYETGNAPRVTPLFRFYTGVMLHNRLDSQRRRSGKESTFAVSS